MRFSIDDANIYKVADCGYSGNECNISSNVEPVCLKHHLCVNKFLQFCNCVMSTLSPVSVLSYFCPSTHFEQSASDVRVLVLCLMNTIYKKIIHTHTVFFYTIQFYVYKMLKIFFPFLLLFSKYALNVFCLLLLCTYI